MKTLRLALVAALAAGSATTLSCNVNEYCINNCGAVEDGGNGDATGDGMDGPTDSTDADTCVPTGNEVCDGKDNDCDTAVDEGQLPEIGDNCDNQTGECAGGVKTCVNGAVSCSKLPAAELCDGLDNDCNGSTDEGDPGGGAKCGTDQGECIAGRLHCNRATGQVQCGLDCGTGTPIDCPTGGITAPFGVAESCDGKDNDCDSDFDEDVPALGPCGGAPNGTNPTNNPNEGLCQQGTETCDGAGGRICTGAVGPAFEDCDGDDNDCDGDTDEDTSFTTDPTNCGACGNVCNLANAINGCRPTDGIPANEPPGECFVIVCEDTFHDNNSNDADGCEFGPCTIQSSIETCNGIDDDCNPATNEANLPPPNNFCLNLGACQGAAATCQGAAGFVCNYNSNVELDVDGNVLQQESRCDNIDNDCDGLVDEGEIGLGEECNDGRSGVCQGTGTLECVPGQPNVAPICVIDDPGQVTPDAAETCDALDNDCDGKTDEGAADGDLAGQVWVTIPNTTPAIEIMKFEASRPDASTTGVGINQVFACSKPNVLPWTNITHPQAEAACSSIGARLCSEVEWQQMCDPRQAFPLAGPGATGFAYVEAENPFATAAGSAAGGGSDTWQQQSPSGTNLQDFSGLGAMRVLSDNGTSVLVGNAPANSARLDYQFNLLASTQYVVWARVLAPSSSSDTLHFGLNLTAPGTANGGTAIVPQLNTWLWVKSGTITSTATAGNHIVSLYMGDDGVFVDAVALTRDTGTTPPPFDERTWAYQTNPKLPQAQVCNGDPVDTGAAAGDQDDVLATASLAACNANGPGSDDAFDMSGNVKEWAAERAANQNPLRGGASNNEVDGLTCGLNFTLADDSFFFPNVGFRCCRVK